MSRRSGRPPRTHRIRARTERREPFDYDALARAVLEQAAADDYARRQAREAIQQPVPASADEQREGDEDDDAVA